MRAADSRLALFLRAALPDFLLVVVVSVALVYTVSYGFYSAEAHRGNIALVAAVQVLVLLPLYWGSWSKRAVVPSAMVTAVVCVAVVGASIALSVDPLMDGLVLSDSAGAYMIFGFVLVVVPIAAYLLSRRPVGMVFLLFVALFACGWIQFMYRDFISGQNGLVALLVVMLGVAALLVFQTYRSSVYQAKHAKSPAFAGAFGSSVAIGAVCLAVGLALFYGVVAPLGAQTFDVKPLEDYYDLRVELYTGTYEEQQVDDPDRTSDDVNDDLKETSQDTEGGDQSNKDSSSGAGASSGSGFDSISSLFDQLNQNETYRNISYFLFDYWYVIVPALVIAAVVAAVLLWRSRREGRLSRLESDGRSYSYRIWYLYEFLMGRFRRLRLLRPFNLTPMEFAIGAKRAMTPFAENTGGVDFVEVTDLYQRVCYGGYQATEADFDKVASYYRAFFGNARLHVGKFKWLWKFWRM